MAISQSLFRVNWNQNGANILDCGVLKTIKDMKSSFAVFPYMNIETINIFSKSNSAVIIIFSPMHHHHQFVTVVLWPRAKSPYPIHLILWASRRTYMRLERYHVVDSMREVPCWLMIQMLHYFEAVLAHCNVVHYAVLCVPIQWVWWNWKYVTLTAW